MLQIIVGIVLRQVRQAVDHDRAPGVPVPGPRAPQILRVRVRHLDREEVVAAGVATPEGSYRLERRNARSDYFLPLKVAYPNTQDPMRAPARQIGRAHVCT